MLIGSGDAGFLALLEAAPDAIVIVDGEGRIALANAQAEALFGYERNEMLGQAIELLVPSRYHRSHSHHRIGYQKAARPRPMGAGLDLYARRKDGSEFPVEISLSPLQRDEATLTISAIRDISDRKSAEAKFRGLLESAPDAIVIVDSSGTITLVNAQAERLFGYGRADMLGRSVEMLVPERYRQAHGSHRGGYFSAAHPRAMGTGLDLFGLRKDGSEFPVEISLSPLETEEGVLVASAIRDVSDRRQAEAERAKLLQERAAHAEASRIKDEFIATLSHELRTPLNAILGWATLLQDGALGPEQTAPAVATIVRNARTQMQLIEDLLDVSRIVAGKLVLRPRPIDFADVVESAIEVVRAAASAKQIALDARYDTRPILLFGDSDRLQQVVWNVLSNAVKFSPRHGRVDVRVWSGDDTVHLIVRDLGPGIHPDFLPHVFDRFRQADSSYTRTHGGLGLGLAIVRSIVELHGGTVSAESPGPEQGTTFRISLPAGAVSHRTPVITVPAVGLPAALDGARILVVDDQPDERELFAAILSAHGARVETAGDVADALARLEAARPDVLLTDIAMPGEDGYVLLRRVRDLGPAGKDLPVVAATAHARLEDRERAEAAGFDAYISKPIDRMRLIAILAGLLRATPRRGENPG